MIDLTIYIALGLTLIYVVIMFFYSYNWRRLPVFEPSTNTSTLNKVSISVLIAARNEELNIEKCLESLFEQNYTGNWEVIVIDDSSTDKTWPILLGLSQRFSKLIILKNRGEGKKSALTTGIASAKYEWIVTTDADCLFQTEWLTLIRECASQNNIQCIAAPVAFYNDKSNLEHFQTLDFCGMMGITGAGIYTRLMRMGNGANLAYRKSVFLEVNGFEGIMTQASGDDMLLMHKIAQRYPSGITFIKHFGATVFTLPISDWKEFMRQRVRWASKSKGYSEWQVTLILAMVYFFSCSILFTAMFSFVSIKIFGVLIIQLIAKITIDYYFLKPLAIFFKRDDLMRPVTFAISTVLHLVYIISIGTYANLVKNYQWKGRIVK